MQLMNTKVFVIYVYASLLISLGHLFTILFYLRDVSERPGLVAVKDYALTSQELGEVEVQVQPFLLGGDLPVSLFDELAKMEKKGN